MIIQIIADDVCRETLLEKNEHSYVDPKDSKASLRRILREAGVENPKSGNLQFWADQGVFLLKEYVLRFDRDIWFAYESAIQYTWISL